MANTKISALTALAGSDLAAGDLLPAVDVSDTTQGASGSTKKMTIDEFLTGILGETSVLDTTYSLASGATFGWSTDLILLRDAANILAQRNGTTAQMQRVYNTYSSGGTNYERLEIGWSGNNASLAIAAGGTGSTSRSLFLTGGGAAYLGLSANLYMVRAQSSGRQVGFTLTALSGSQADSAIYLSQTWNTSGNPTIFEMDVTNTASGAASLLANWKVGAASKFKVAKDGSVTLTGDLIPGGTLATNMTSGFYNVPGAAGAPSGTPAVTTGFPMYYDSTGNKIYVYNGSWRSTAALT